MIDLALIRASHPLPAIVGASVKLIRAGNEWKGLCPLHSERSPSFTIFAGGAKFHCFGCGASGDIFDYLSRMHGVTLREAASMLEGGQVPTVVHRPLSSEPERSTVETARKIWMSGGPIEGTPGAAYLFKRGITMKLPDSLRFAHLKHPSGQFYPAVIALVVTPDRRIGGVQRIFVAQDGHGKARVTTPKLSLGRIAGNAIRLGAPAREVIVTEGLEDALSVQQELGKVTWASAGASMMSKMVFPLSVRSVVIGQDNDPAGEREAVKAAAAFAERDVSARVMRPTAPYKDWNEQLLACGEAQGEAV